MNRSEDYIRNLNVIIRNINFFRNMISSSTSRCQRLYFEEQLFNQITRYNYWQGKLNIREGNIKIFTTKELGEYDGANGKPAYIAINGKVYDVSNEATWGGGTHFGLYAGKDLTNYFIECHNGNIKYLENLPIVGELDE